jgi:hypothetical protein
MSLADDFKSDSHGCRFADVWRDQRIDFNTVCTFFEDCDVQRRMAESEMHHDRPALAGAVRALESVKDVRDFFEKHGRKDTGRFRQAVGVLVRIVMERHGWRTTGRKGSLGTPPRSVGTKPRLNGRNKGGLAVWFNRAERYELQHVAASSGHRR